MNLFDKAMSFRFACKNFDATKKISQDNLNFILDAGRRSPSSFGLEPWHYLIIENQELRQKIRKVCWDQPQVTDCSHFIILLSRKPHFFEGDSDYLKQCFGRAIKNNTMLNSVLAKFENFQKYQLKPKLEDWAKMQVYLSSANMMTAAAYIGIDSCPIEGFGYTDLETLLSSQLSSFNKDDFAIAFCIALGYRNGEQTPQIRYPLDQIVTYIK